MNPLFQVHLLNDDGVNKAKAMAQNFSALVDELETILGDGIKTREFSIVKTKLEEAAFFAKKAMANQPENQKEK